MAQQILKNNCYGVLAAGIAANTAALPLLDASQWPELAAGDWCLATLIGLNENGQESAWEVVKVIGKLNNTLTVERAHEGMPARGWPAGTVLQMRLTAGSVATPSLVDAVRLALTQLIDEKVSAEPGMGLVSDAQVQKLTGIAAGAQVNVATNIGQGTRTATGIPLTSSTGAGTTLPVATTALAGLMASADKTKLDGVAAGAQVNVATNLGLGTAAADSRIITSSTGASVTLPAATSSTAGLMTAAESVKLGTVASNASANSSDAFLLNRVNHSGTQPLNTITGTGTAAAMNAVGAGGIIERGSNTNGSYTKFTDGTLICTYTKTLNVPVDPGTAISVNRDFAAVFTSVDSVAAVGAFFTGYDATGNQIYSINFGYFATGVPQTLLFNTGINPSTSHPGFVVGTLKANSLQVQALAIGKWK